MQATDISSTSSIESAFELVHNAQPWVAPFEDDFAEAENPVPYRGPTGASSPPADFGGSVANGHAEQVQALFIFNFPFKDRSRYDYLRSWYLIDKGSLSMGKFI